MQVALVGAGAVGCYYGGLLLRAGHDVTFIGRQPHVDAINAHGLLLDTRTFNGHLPAKAATDATALPVVVYVGSEMAGPGHVRHHGGGDLAIGASAASEALAQTLQAAGIHATISDDIDRTLWSKLIINCAFNALSAVADISYGPMLEVEGTRDVVASAVQEAVSVARACGVSIADDIIEQILKIPAAMPNQMSSTAQDLARGKPSEIDFLNGYVVRKGAELGIPTPTNQALQVMVKLAQCGKALSRK